MRTWSVEKVGGACACEQVFETISHQFIQFCCVVKDELFGIFFYVEAKSFEIQSKDGEGGVHFVERSRETYRALILGKLSMMWLRSTVEELVMGVKLGDFYRKFRSGI